MEVKNENEEKKQFRARVDVIKDALTAATTLMDEMLAHKKVFRDYEKKWVELQDKPGFDGQLMLPLPLVLLVGLTIATKTVYNDPPRYTAHTFAKFLEEAYPSIAPFLETLMFPVTLDSDIELDKIKDAYDGKTEKSQREVEDEAKLHGDVTVKDWIRGKKNGKTH
jgi:hypothetical protein